MSDRPLAPVERIPRSSPRRCAGRGCEEQGEIPNSTVGTEIWLCQRCYAKVEMALIEIDLGRTILYKEGYARIRGYVIATQGARGGVDSRVARIRASSHYLYRLERAVTEVVRDIEWGMEDLQDLIELSMSSAYKRGEAMASIGE